ncbi:MAG: discoidin domain-containing protein, partial [Bacteroidetes bacterium]|nr:discoidin domain-containing protein [Bacteroidota bacterium]
ITLIDKYESERYPIDAPDPIEAMGEILDATGFTYLPGNGSESGVVEHYRFMVSLDGKRWEESASGYFGNIKNNPVLQEVRFIKTQKCRYFRFEALSDVDGNNQRTVDEVGVIN